MSTTELKGHADTADPGLARRSLGSWSLGFFPISASAPLTVFIAGVGATYAVTGVVAGVPLGYLLLPVPLWLLSIGYVSVNGHLKHAAPFVAVLAHGLGRPAGVSGGLLALLGYGAVQLALYPFAGATLAATFGGPWLLWAVFLTAIISVIGARRSEIVARVLAGLTLAEVLLIVVIILVSLTNPAPGTSLTSIAHHGVVSGDIGAMVALSVAGFLGWDSSGAYAEEAQTDRAVRLATYGALIGLGPLYALSALSPIIAVGPDQIGEAASNDRLLPLTILSDHLGPFFGPVFAAIGQGLLLTSIAGSLLSFNPTTNRYLYGMARERILPRALAVTGERWQRAHRDAPVFASVIQAVVTVAVLVLLAALGMKPEALFTWLAALAAFSIITLLVLSSLSAMRFKPAGVVWGTFWTRRAGPALGVLSGAGLLLIMLWWMHTLLGVQQASWHTRLQIPVLVVSFFVIGLLWGALIFAVNRKVYAGIGSGRQHPLAVPARRMAEPAAAMLAGLSIRNRRTRDPRSRP